MRGAPAARHRGGPDVLLADARLGGCQRLPSIAAPAGGPPLAILHDVAAAATEYLIGSPGRHYVKITQSSGYSAPIIAGGKVYYSASRGSASEVRFGALGGCTTRLADGYLWSVDPNGRGMVVSPPQGGSYLLLDATGKVLKKLTGSPVNWTYDGHLVMITAGALQIVDVQGNASSLSSDRSSGAFGPFGPSGEVIGNALKHEVVDARPSCYIPLEGTFQLARGSVDGQWLANLNQNTWTIKRQSDGHTVSVPQPAPVTGVLFAPDSSWFAVQTLYGGELVHLPDGAVTDLGPLVVSTW